MQKVYTEVFENIIREMEQGNAPWVKPWVGGPYNAATGRRYSGGNVLGVGDVADGHIAPKLIDGLRKRPAHG